MQRVVRLALIMGIVLGAAGPVRAGMLIARESFTGYSGSVTGQNGGFGWDGAWSNGSHSSIVSATVTAPGLTYSGLTSSGDKSTFMHSAGQVGQNDRTIDTASLPSWLTITSGPSSGAINLGADDTTVWVSFLARNDNGGTREYRASIGAALVEQADGASTWSLRDGQAAPAPGIDTGKSTLDTSLLLLRFDFAAGSGTDLVRLWVNPNDVTSAPTGAADASLLGNFSFNRISFLANAADGTYTATRGSFDEIRLGTEFADVVPEPAMVSLFTLGLVCLSRRRSAQR